MADATVTFSLLDVLGLPFDARRTKVWAEFNTDDGWVIDEDGKIRMDAGSATIDDTGLVTLAGIPVPGGTTNPTDWQVKIHYDVPVTLPGSRGKTRKRDDFGWMTITADADLTDLIAEQYVPPTWLSTAISTLQGMIDDAGDDFDVKLASAQDLLDAQVALSGISSTDSAVSGLVSNNALGPLTRAALRSLIAGDIGTPASAIGAALTASFAQRWKANTVYAAGDTVVAPDGSLVKAKANFTSGTSYNAANWASVGATAGTQAASELAATYVGLADSAVLSRLDMLAVSAMQTSLATSRNTYTDAHSRNEAWADLAAWTSGGGGGGAATVSGGYFIGTAAVGSSGWATYDALVLTNIRARMKCLVTVPAANGTDVGALVIGFTTTTSGAAATGNLWGLQLNSADNVVKSWVGGSANAIVTPDSGAATPMAPGNYIAEVTVDDFGTSLVLTATDGAPMTCIYRTAEKPGRFMIFNSDHRGASGLKVGKTVIRGGLASATDRTIESQGVSTFWGFDTAALDHGIVMMLPPTWDSRTPLPLVVHHHGRSAYTFPELNHYRVPVVTPTIEALLAAGYAVLSVRGGTASTAGGVNGWGNDASQVPIENAVKWARARYPIGPILLYGYSMGGIQTLRTLTRRTVPGIVGWYGVEPVCNLANMYAAGTYAADIRAAYNVAADGSDLAAKTAANDPVLLPATAYRGVPMRFAASPGDTVVSKAQNADLLYAKLQGYAPEVSMLTTTGDHDASTQFVASDIVSFFNRCLG